RPPRRRRIAPPRRAARAPSSAGCRRLRPRAAAPPAGARGRARGSARNFRTPESLLARCAPLLERFGDLRRHVVLVVLGEHLLGREVPARLEAAAGDDALAF